MSIHTPLADCFPREAAAGAVIDVRRRWETGEKIKHNQSNFQNGMIASF
jgi:hypothetical protein